jgi:hypothetical protein
VEEFLAENKMTVIPRLPYALDLALYDVFHFPKLKVVLKGRRFYDTIMIQALGYACPLSNSALHVMLQRGCSWWAHYIKSQGDYSQGAAVIIKVSLWRNKVSPETICSHHGFVHPYFIF